MKQEIKKIIKDVVGQEVPEFSVEVSDNEIHGDYSSNVALILAKKLGKNPREVAQELVGKISAQGGSASGGKSDLFSKIDVAGPGFINFFISNKVFLDAIKKINDDFGKNKELKGQKIVVDYTDPNPFKDFHIGHLVNNSIGESLARIFELAGAKVKRICYQGDVGIHVAKAIWGKLRDQNLEWGQAYAFGNKFYEDDENVKKEIQELNKKIYERSDKNINKLYDQGKKESLAAFDKIYEKLGTKFDDFIFESQSGPVGKEIVLENLGKIFHEGDNGAIIFKGEKFGLHTRVFINSEGLPTYEAKDLGLANIKNKKYKYDNSVVVTGNEVNDYFKVMLCALEQINPELAKKTKHIGHGMLRLPEGKMSSRTGNVVTGESLIEKVQELVKEKNKDENISEAVAIGAIKYSILKQSIGSDIIYDFNKSISFEGDSGPYLQYAYARAESVLRKAKAEKVKPSLKIFPEQITQLEKKICQFPEVVSKSAKNFEPHFLVLYLTELAGEFNNYYAKNKIADSPYRLALTANFAKVMKNGLWLLGIKTLEKM